MHRKLSQQSELVLEMVSRVVRVGEDALKKAPTEAEAICTLEAKVKKARAEANELFTTLAKEWDNTVMRCYEKPSSVHKLA